MLSKYTGSEDSKMIIFFDGDCNLCSRTVQFILKYDVKNVFLLASLQSRICEEILEGLGITVKGDSIILVNGSHCLYKSSAMLTILKNLSMPWKFLYAFIILPKCIRDYIYEYISRRRKSFFGDNNYCLVPSEFSKSKILG